MNRLKEARRSRNKVWLVILGLILVLLFVSGGKIKTRLSEQHNNLPLYFPIVQVSPTVSPSPLFDTAKASRDFDLLTDVTNNVQGNILPLFEDNVICSSNTTKIKKKNVTVENINNFRLEVFDYIDNEEITGKAVCLTKHGQLVYQHYDYSFAPLLPDYIKDENGDFLFLETAQDFKRYALRNIAGSKNPELIYQSYSGGAHCCITNKIIELGRGVNILSDLYTGNSHALLSDINNDGVDEIITYDDVYAYWNASYASSPKPEVVLSFDKQKNKYVASTYLMQKPAPTREEVQLQAEGWCWEEMCQPNRPEDSNYRVPWGYVLDLLYSGNAETARSYIDLVWTDNEMFASKEDFWRKFNDQLEKSQFYSQIFQS